MATQPQLLQIRAKVQQLVKLLQQAQKQVQQLQKENTLLKQTIASHADEISRAEQKKAAVGVVSLLHSPTEKKELEKKINAFLKEIDKCLAMLNA